MRALVLGGTRFLGRAIVDALLAAGHEPTLFNRGLTQPELFPNVEKYLGERFADDEALTEFLLSEAQTAVVPGSSFGAPGHLRISFSTGEEAIKERFPRIKAALNK